MGNDKREWKRDEGRAAGRLEVLTHSSEISATVAAISKQADAHTESEKEKKGRKPTQSFYSSCAHGWIESTSPQLQGAK